MIYCLVSAAQVSAGPTISETVRYYTISGDSFAELRQAMARDGPEGHWGYTRWWITWTSTCEVDLEITVTIPRLSASATLSDRDKAVWENMVDALMRHEQLHAEHGRRAADEIHSERCLGAHQVIDKWTARDRALDQSTQNGQTEGVWLPN